MSDAQATGRKIINGITLAVLIWGLIHAIGAYVFNEGGWHVLKAVIIYAFVVAFLIFWTAVLSLRTRRLRQRDDSKPST